MTGKTKTPGFFVRVPDPDAFIVQILHWYCHRIKGAELMARVEVISKGEQGEFTEKMSHATQRKLS